MAGLYVAQRRPTARGSVSLASADAAEAALVRDGWKDGSAAAAHDREVLHGVGAGTAGPAFARRRR